MDKWAKDYWNDRYNSGHNSGYGSYDDQLDFKLMWLKELRGIETISEIGCGDFNFGKHVLELFPNARYVGSDISEVIVQKNQELYPQQVFTTDNSEVPPADLVLCVDVLFHIIDEEELSKILEKLESIWKKYLVITAYEREEEKTNHVRIRNFDYKRFGEPILRKVVEEDGKMYFYIFKK